MRQLHALLLLGVLTSAGCDFEDTTNWRCESVCGPADPARQAQIVDAAVRAATAAVPR